VTTTKNTKGIIFTIDAGGYIYSQEAKTNGCVGVLSAYMLFTLHFERF